MSRVDHGHTVHMTAEESERMRQTVRTRFQKCKEMRGQKRTPRDRVGAVQQATGASLMLDMAGEPDPGMSVTSGDKAMVALAIGEPFPPSTVPLEDLKPISLAELEIDTHHRGRILSVKGASPVVPMVAFSWTMVEDDSGEVERLEVYLHKSKRGEDMLDTDDTLKIKEPYFTINEQGEPAIRIHHPSDLIRVVDRSVKESTSVAKKAKKLKDRGNAALKKKEYAEAAANYLEGLNLAADDAEAKESVVSDLHRNRAHVDLILTRLDDAKMDAVAAIIGKDDEKHRSLDSKANFRAGTAAYNLGLYEESKGFFQASLDLTPDDKEAKAYLRSIEARLLEQTTGKYDFQKLKLKLSKARPRVDAATYTGPTVVRESPGAGRGLFITRDFEAGELIICEKAFYVAWSHEKDAWTAMTYDTRDDRIRAFPAGLTKAIVQKLLNNPSYIEKFMDLYGDYKGLGKQTIIQEDGPVLDTYQVHDIVSRNAFGPGPVIPGETETVRNASTGLWLHSAYTNHSCLPNTSKDHVGDLMIFRALRDIKAGEEITHSYDESPDYDARQAALMTTWGFTCNCRLCAVESKDDTVVRKKRRELIREANDFVQREPTVNAKRLTIAKAERLSKSIGETYDDEMYNGLPRAALAPIQYWLSQVKT